MNLTEVSLEATKAELATLCAFASKDLTRPHLASVCIDRAKGYVCATDGHRLLIWRGEPSKGARVLVPAAKLSRLLNWKPEVPPRKRREPPAPPLFRLVPGERSVTIALPGVEFSIAQTMNVEYPPIEQVLPKRGDKDPVACVAFAPRLLLGLIPLIGNGAGVVFQPGQGELDPILVKLDAPGWTCVLMPFRAEGTYPAAVEKKARKK